MVRIRFAPPIGWGIAGLLATSAVASAQEPTERMSVSSSGEEANNDTNGGSISANGRHVAFNSRASNLAANDSNGDWDVFVHDRDPDGNGVFDEGSGLTAIVSVTPAGSAGNRESLGPVLSADGRFVAFWSFASDLVPNDTNRRSDAFVRDRDADGNGVFDEGNGVTTRVSIGPSGLEGNGASALSSIAPDGRYVAFGSTASNLVANDTNGFSDAFVHDRDPDGNGIFDEGNGITRRMSLDSTGHEGNGGSVQPLLSASGRHVAFYGIASNLVSNDTNGFEDVFVRDRDPDGNGVFDEGNEITTRVSVDSSGLEGDGDSYVVSISSDGRHVLFISEADNLVANDTNSFSDVFAHDRDPDGNGIFDEGNGVTTRMNVDSAGSEGDGASYVAAISANGQIVAFADSSDNLVADDTNGSEDVFTHDRDPDGNGVFDEGNGVTARVSLSSCDIEGDRNAVSCSISADARYVTFDSDSSNVVSDEQAYYYNVYVRDRLAPPAPGASWSNYGAGYPGTLGIPGFTSSANPVLATSIILTIDNSQGIWSIGFLIAGSSQASIPTSAGGTLLVGQEFLIEALPIAPFAGLLPVDVPKDPGLCGLAVFLQVLEIDAGAQHGLSFTPGLELDLGH